MDAPWPLGAVELKVLDLEREGAFYESFGLTRITGDPQHAVFGADGSAILRLTALPGGHERPRHTAGLYHFAILLPSPQELGGFLQRTLEERLPLTGTADHFVSQALYFDDPEGNGIEVYADRPRGRPSERPKRNPGDPGGLAFHRTLSVRRVTHAMTKPVVLEKSSCRLWSRVRGSLDPGVGHRGGIFDPGDQNHPQLASRARPAPRQPGRSHRLAGHPDPALADSGRRRAVGPGPDRPRRGLVPRLRLRPGDVPGLVCPLQPCQAGAPDRRDRRRRPQRDSGPASLQPGQPALAGPDTRSGRTDRRVGLLHP